MNADNVVNAGNSTRRKENWGLPVGACDCHVHVYGPFDRFPLAAAAPFHPAAAPVQALENLWDTFGITRGVLVQGSAYRQDHRALMDAIHRDPESRRGIALVGPATAVDELNELNANGICGARINFVRHLGKGFEEAFCWEVAKRIETLGWHLELHLDAADLPKIRAFVHESPVDVVIDHMGRVDAMLGLQQEAFRTLLELANHRRCWVKLSGADRLFEPPAAGRAGDFPLGSAVAFARALVAIAPDRVVWGTDWPHVNHERPPRDEALFDLLREIAPDSQSRTRLLVDNPARLYGFSVRREDEGPPPARNSDPRRSSRDSYKRTPTTNR